MSNSTHEFPVPGEFVLYDDEQGSPTIAYLVHHIEEDDVLLVKDNKYYVVRKEYISGHALRSAPKYYCHFV